MANTCSVCKHGSRLEIEKALVNGESLREVASRFQVTKSALARHMDSHLKPALARAAERTRNTTDREVGQVEPETANREDDLFQYAVARKSRRLEVLDRVHSKLAAQVEKRNLSEMSDSDVVKLTSKTSEQAAREMNQWDEQTGKRGTAGKPVVVIVVPQVAAAGQATRVLQMDIPGQIAVPQEVIGEEG